MMLVLINIEQGRMIPDGDPTPLLFLFFKRRNVFRYQATKIFRKYSEIFSVRVVRLGLLENKKRERSETIVVNFRTLDLRRFFGSSMGSKVKV